MDEKSILAINFGGIGDEILFLPALISLKNEYPGAKITLALEPRSKGIKDLTNIINDTILVDIKSKDKYLQLFKFIIEARKRKFDLAITAGSNKFMSTILLLTGAKRRYGYDTGFLSRLLLTRTVKLNKNQYACQMYHDLVTPITNRTTTLPEVNIEKLKKERNTILIHPGVSQISVSLGMIKTVPPKIWADTIDMLIEKGKKVILVGGPDDKDCIEEIRNTILHKDNINFVDYYGKTKSLKDLAELISSAEIFLCSDSAPLHIAVALQTKTYVIFGPTDYKKLIPNSPNIVPIFANDNCNLKPCLWEKRKTTCKELFCLDITPEQIVSTICQ